MNLISKSIRRIRKYGFWNFARATYGYLHIDPTIEAITLPFIIEPAKKDFIKKSKEPKTVKELVDFAFNYHYFKVNIVPGQTPEEITEFIELLKNRKPKKIMEIGTSRGGTLFLLTRAAAPDAKIISVSYQVEKIYVMCEKQWAKLIKVFPREKQDLHIVNGNSHNKATFLEAKKLLKNDKLDVLFIDADHTYSGVKTDYTMYSSLVKKGGIIAFHDISGSPQNNVNSVSDYWRITKKRYSNAKEFAIPGGLGIGMITK
jgi:predicted O-methyltransferase YrrM